MTAVAPNDFGTSQSATGAMQLLPDGLIVTAFVVSICSRRTFNGPSHDREEGVAYSQSSRIIKRSAKAPWPLAGGADVDITRLERAIAGSGGKPLDSVALDRWLRRRPDSVRSRVVSRFTRTLPGRACPEAGTSRLSVGGCIEFDGWLRPSGRSEEHTSELQSLMRIS